MHAVVNLNNVIFGFNIKQSLNTSYFLFLIQNLNQWIKIGCPPNTKKIPKFHVISCQLYTKITFMRVIFFKNSLEEGLRTPHSHWQYSIIPEIKSPHS